MRYMCNRYIYMRYMCIRYIYMRYMCIGYIYMRYMCIRLLICILRRRFFAADCGGVIMDCKARPTIMIVDNSEFHRVELREILEQDYAVCMAEDGNTALRLVDEFMPSLILLEVVLPDLSGFDVLTRLKENTLTHNIPVIFITTMNTEQDEEKGFSLGAVDYIFKPFRSVSVKARIHTHMQIASQIQINERLSMIDPLTELPNRRGFNKRFSMEWRRAIREGNPISFFMIDVDKFKTYNDTYGHMQGDRLLISLGKLLYSYGKRPADFAVRLGGEEFGMILPNTDAKGAYLVAERLREGVAGMKTPNLDGDAEDTSVTVSIGIVTTWPVVNSDMSVFIANADKCLYDAKDGGRNRSAACEI